MKGFFVVAIFASLTSLATAEISDPYKDEVKCSLLGFYTCWTDCSDYNNGIPNCCETHFSGFTCTCKALSIDEEGVREPTSVADLLSSQIGCAASSVAGFWGGILGDLGK